MKYQVRRELVMWHEKIEMIGIDIKGLIKRQKHDGSS